MNTALDLISGISWSIVYVTAFILGIKHKTWYIPRLAICQNFSWEFWMVTKRIRAGSPFSIAFIIQLSWLVLDLGVLFTWLKYDRKDIKRVLKNAILLLLIFTMMYLFALHAERWEVSAFLINIIMSVAFIVREERGEDLYPSRVIAIAKMIGTLSATILNGIVFRNLVLLWLGGLCFIFDCSYLRMICKRQNELRVM